MTGSNNPERRVTAGQAGRLVAGCSGVGSGRFAVPDLQRHQLYHRWVRTLCRVGCALVFPVIA